MGWTEILLLAIVQGLTEFLPVSSSGHLVVGNALLGALGYPLAKDLVEVSIALHMGTLASVLVYYRREIARMLGSDRRVIPLLILATIPAAIVGVGIKKGLSDTVQTQVLDNIVLVGFMLPVTAMILIAGSRRTAGTTDYPQMSWGQALAIGVAQSVAILPGISRSGTTIAAGLGAGLTRESASTFAFLMAIPAILGAGVLETLDILEDGSTGTPVARLAVGFVVSFVVGLAALSLLIQFVTRQARRVRLVPGPAGRGGARVAAGLCVARGPRRRATDGGVTAMADNSAGDWPDYELIDFGAGRRLERFGAWLLDRPCPAAIDDAKQRPEAWRDAIARYDGARATDGDWTPKPRSGAKSWAGEATIAVPLRGERAFTLGLTPTPAGQIGVFPEQLTNWRWIAERVARLAALRPDNPPRVLNLFAYTGGSTLAAAAAGATVTHVDASKPSVELARENAERSGLADAPVRWIVEDVLRYCQREVKRGSRYDAVILDPPTYGHGPKGEAWRLERDLPVLLDLCATLVDRAPQFFLATCHTPGIGPAELSAYLSDAIVGHCGQPPASGRLWLATAAGRRLESGVWARWPR
jgi:undecaprenyl-diphosphatase UppP